MDVPGSSVERFFISHWTISAPGIEGRTSVRSGQGAKLRGGHPTVAGGPVWPEASHFHTTASQVKSVLIDVPCLFYVYGHTASQNNVYTQQKNLDKYFICTSTSMHILLSKFDQMTITLQYDVFPTGGNCSNPIGHFGRRYPSSSWPFSSRCVYTLFLADCMHVFNMKMHF